MSDALLRFRDDQGTEREFGLDPRTITNIGSKPDNQLVLPGEQILPIHIQTRFDGRTWIYRCDPQRPVTLNGEPASQGRLKNGDAMQVGPYLLVFEETRGAPSSLESFGIDDSGTLANLLPDTGSPSNQKGALDLEALESEIGSSTGLNEPDLAGLVAETGVGGPSSEAFNLAGLDDAQLEPVTEESLNPGMLSPKPGAPGGGPLDDLSFEPHPSPRLSEPDLQSPGPPGPGKARIPDSTLSLDEEPVSQDAPPGAAPSGPSGSSPLEPLDPDADISNIHFSDSTDGEPATQGTGFEMREAVSGSPTPVQFGGPPVPSDKDTDTKDERHVDTIQESGVKLVSDDAADEGFVSLGGQGTGYHPRRHATVVRSRETDNKQMVATIAIATVIVAVTIFFGYVLFKPPPEAPDSPVFEGLLEAFVEAEDDEVRELEKEFWDSPASETQKARVKEMMTVLELRDLSGEEKHAAVVKAGEIYLGGDPHYRFVVAPLMQKSLLQLAKVRKEEGDLTTAGSYLTRVTKLAFETDKAAEARMLLEEIRRQKQASQVESVSKERFGDLKSDVEMLFVRTAYREVLKRYEEVLKLFPKAREDPDLRRIVKAAADAIEKAEVGTIQLVKVTGIEARELLVEPTDEVAPDRLPITPTLFLPAGKEPKAVDGKETFQPGDPDQRDLVVVLEAGALWGLNPETGRICWFSPVGGSGGIRPVEVPLPNAPPQILAYDAAARQLQLVSSADGKERWRIQLKGKLCVLPHSNGRRIWLGTEPEGDEDWPPRALVIDAFSGQLVARADLPSPPSCAPVEDRFEAGGGPRSFLYVCTRKGQLYVVSLADGSTVQGLELKGIAVQPPLKVPPFLLVFQSHRNQGLVTVARVTENGLGEREERQNLPMAEPPETMPSVDAALVFAPGDRGSITALGVEVQRDESPVYDAGEGAQGLGLGPRVHVTATEEGRHLYAAGRGLKSLEFRQFEKAGRYRARWAFTGQEGWPQPGTARGPVIQRRGRVLLWTSHLKGPGGLVWSLEPQTGRIQWCVSVGGSLGCAPLVVSDEKLFLRTGNGRLLAAMWQAEGVLLEPRDYDVAKLNDFRRYASPPVPADVGGTPTLFFGNHDGQFYAIARSTGFLAWKNPFSCDAPVVSAPLVIGDVATFSAGTHVYGLKTRDGSKVYDFSVAGDSPFLTPPRLIEGLLLVGNRDGAVYGLQPVKEASVPFLKEQWKFETDGPVRSPVVSAGGLILAGSDDGRLYGLSAEGALKRRWPLGGPVTAGPVAHGDRVFVGTQNGRIVCIAPEADDPVWHWRLDARVEPCSLLVSENRLLVGTVQGDLLLFSAEDGSKIRSLRAGRAAVRGMALSKSRLFVASDDGHLYSFPSERIAAP